MPRGGNTEESAFFQVGITRKENTIQGMCIPSLANLAPTYARMAVHYVVACLKKIKGEDLLFRVITEEASFESQQFVYDLKSHTVKAIVIAVPNTLEVEQGMEGFDDVASPLAKT
eukprot:12665715-Ditylum_brightwellii.AAC.1